MAIEKAFNDVKSIEFQVFFDGDGCVNYDTSEQIFQLNKLGFIKNDSRFRNGEGLSKNIKLAKKIFRENIQNGGEYEQCTYISATCLRNSLFGDTIKFQSPTVANNPYVLHTCIAHPSMLLRGYVYPCKKKPLSSKRSIYYNKRI